MNFPATFKNSYFLEVWSESPVGSPHGETSIVPKCCGFPTTLTLCHYQFPFRCIIAFYPELIPGFSRNQGKILP